MNPRPVEIDALLTPGEVAAMFRVDPKTVTRWAQAGKVSSIRTLGGHRRFLESEVRALMAGMGPEQGGTVPEQARRVPRQTTRGE
ncbi:MAG: BldC family transcriptional regulator [Nocardioidaceae bacterium]